MMFVLKLPIFALFAIIWWAVRDTPEDAADASGEGGALKPLSPHPRGPLPRSPRRGPHGELAPPAPARTRGTTRRQRDRA